MQQAGFHALADLRLKGARQDQWAPPQQPGAVLEPIYDGDGFLAGDEVIEQGASGVNIGAGVGLCFAASEMLRAGVADFAERDGVAGLPWLVDARYAKVNQVELAGAVLHDVIW
jgi:hypothetical protein